MNTEKALNYALSQGFSVEIKAVGEFYAANLCGHGTNFIGTGISVSEALSDAVESLNCFAEDAQCQAT